MLYLKAFIIILKAFTIWLSAVSKIKVKVFIAFWANKRALVRNTIGLKGFTCYY